MHGSFVHRYPLFALCLAMVWSADALGSDLITVALKRQADVAGDVVRLGDVATVYGADSQTVERLTNATLPARLAVGDTKRLESAAIREAAAASGFNLARMRFVGAYEVHVRRTENPAESEKESSRDWETTVYKAVTQDVKETASGDVQVEIEGRRAFEYLDSQNPRRWGLSLPSEWRLGTQSVELEIPTESGVARYPLQVTIQRLRQTVVATRRIPKGMTIEADAVRTVSQAVAGDDAGILGSLENVVGKEAARTIDIHQILRKKDVQTPPVVFRGSPITLLIRQGTVSLEMTAIAGDDGAEGDWIEVVNPATKKPLKQRARVVGLQSAVLAEPGAQPDEERF